MPTLSSSGIFCFEEPPRELPLASLSSLPVKRSQLMGRLNTTESMTLLICFCVTAPKRWLPWLTEPLGLPPPFLELLFFFSSFWAGSAASASVGIQYDTIRYDTIRYDTIRYDTIRYDTIRYLLRHWMLAWLRRSLCPPSACAVRHRPGPPWRQSPSASRLVSPSPQLQPLIAKVGGNMVTIYTSYVFIIVA